MVDDLQLIRMRLSVRFPVTGEKMRHRRLLVIIVGDEKGLLQVARPSEAIDLIPVQRQWYGIRQLTPIAAAAGDQDIAARGHR